MRRNFQAPFSPSNPPGNTYNASRFYRIILRPRKEGTVPAAENRARVLQLDPRDNVLVALTNLPAGAGIEFAGVIYQLVRSVPAKHKFALRDFAPGDEVVM